jgi:hypothetical protein
MGSVLDERMGVRVEASRELHIPPEQLDHPATATAEIEDGAFSS